jgi:hypothetical protein
LRILPDGSYDTALVTEKEDASAQIVAASTVKLDTDKYLVRTQEGLTYGQRRIGILNIKSASLPALPFPK